MQSFKDAFLHLVRLGIGHGVDVPFKNLEWTSIKALSEQHGLSGIVIDGLDKANTNLTNKPPQSLILEWIGEVMQNYEVRYKQYKKAIGELVGFYAQHGIKMMVLKGYACSLNWPRPEHRPCGDIDIWLFGKQKEADAALVSSFKFQDSGFKIDTSHHHHTVFSWGEFTVENHYDFVNVHAHRSSAELEKVFKELGKDDSHFVEIGGNRVHIPSPNLHALFLIRHMVSHFAAAEISLRQVLDWGFFVEKHHEEVDWGWLLGLLEKYHMNEFFNIINAICVENLGFKTEIFPTVQFLPELKEKVLNDILEPEYGASEPTGLMPRIVYKYRRWQGNAWKQKLCYPESRWKYFLLGIWAKMLKPASF